MHPKPKSKLTRRAKPDSSRPGSGRGRGGGRPPAGPVRRGRGPKGEGMTRRASLAVIGGAVVAIAGGTAFYYKRKAAKIKESTKVFEAKKIRAPAELAELTFEHGLSEKEAFFIAEITKELRKIDGSMTHTRIVETIGRNSSEIGSGRIVASTPQRKRVKFVLQLIEAGANKGGKDEKFVFNLWTKLNNQFK